MAPWSAGPPPRAHRGDGQGRKESLMGPGAIDQAGLPCPGAPLSWSGCGFDLGTTSDSKVPTRSQVRRRPDRGDIEHGSGGATFARSRGRALGPPDQIQQLALD